MPKIVHARIHPVFLPGASEHQRVKIKKNIGTRKKSGLYGSFTGK